MPYLHVQLKIHWIVSSYAKPLPQSSSIHPSIRPSRSEAPLPSLQPFPSLPPNYRRMSRRSTTPARLAGRSRALIGRRDATTIINACCCWLLREVLPVTCRGKSTRTLSSLRAATFTQIVLMGETLDDDEHRSTRPSKNRLQVVGLELAG